MLEEQWKKLPPVEQTLAALRTQAARERLPHVAYEQLVFAVGRALAATDNLAATDPDGPWPHAQRLLEQVSRIAARHGKPPASE